MPMYHKVNGRLAVDPATGRRARGRGARARAGPVSRVSFGTFVIAAVIGWKTFQILSRSVFGGRRRHGGGAAEEGAVVAWASDDEDEVQQLPPLVRARPARLIIHSLCPLQRLPMPL